MSPLRREPPHGLVSHLQPATRSRAWQLVRVQYTRRVPRRRCAGHHVRKGQGRLADAHPLVQRHTHRHRKRQSLLHSRLPHRQAVSSTLPRVSPPPRTHLASRPSALCCPPSSLARCVAHNPRCVAFRVEAPRSLRAEGRCMLLMPLCAGETRCSGRWATGARLRVGLTGERW